MPQTRLHPQNTAVHNQLYITLFRVQCKDFSPPSWECKFELPGFVIKTCAMDDSAPPTRIVIATTLPSPSLPKLHLVRFTSADQVQDPCSDMLQVLMKVLKKKNLKEFRLCKSSLGETFFFLFFSFFFLSLSLLARSLQYSSLLISPLQLEAQGNVLRVGCSQNKHPQHLGQSFNLGDTPLLEDITKSKIPTRVGVTKCKMPT